jgi:hypothetical protein
MLARNIIKRFACNYCGVDRLCVGTTITFKKNVIEVKKENPCNECKNFLLKKEETLGKCQLFHLIENPKEKADVLLSRSYMDLCGPCGKHFIKK